MNETSSSPPAIIERASLYLACGRTKSGLASYSSSSLGAHFDSGKNQFVSSTHSVGRLWIGHRLPGWTRSVSA